MNYFAHGRGFLDRPCFLAGTAVPDWLNVVARRIKARRRHAQAFVADGDERVAEVARGVVRHHADDAWFHQSATFADLSWRFTAIIRDSLPADDGLRPSFLGHILVEILLDAHLIASAPNDLEEYYRALAEIDPPWLEATVARMATGHPQSLAEFIPLFLRERFLWDYLDDVKLLYRLNQVMRRVGLATLPPALGEAIPQLRRQVALRADDLLAAP